MSRKDDFKTLVETFLEESGMAPTALGKAALGDPNFVRELRAGQRSFSLATVEKVEGFISSARSAPAQTEAAE